MRIQTRGTAHSFPFEKAGRLPTTDVVQKHHLIDSFAAYTYQATEGELQLGYGYTETAGAL